MISGHKSCFLFLSLSLVLYAGAFHCPQILAQQHDFWGESSKTTPAPGQHAFNTNCAGCHGLDGRGSDKGPNIAASVNVRHLSDARVSRIISDGIPGTGMPAFHSLSAQQTRAIVGYIRLLEGRLEARTPSRQPHAWQSSIFRQRRMLHLPRIVGRRRICWSRSFNLWIRFAGKNDSRRDRQVQPGRTGRLPVGCACYPGRQSRGRGHSQ